MTRLDDFLTDINLNTSNPGYRTLPGMKQEQKTKFIATLLACLKAAYVFDPGVIYCNLSIAIVCWPPTKAKEVAVLQCFDYDILDTRSNATRKCDENGTWARPNFTSCFKEEFNVDKKIAWYDSIYLIGYSMTCLTLIAAIGIFFYFKSLRCLRNLIHCNLMIAMFLSSFLYILVNMLLHKLKSLGIMCHIPIVILTYFNTSVYFWMFVEGLYLFIIVMWAYEAHKIRLYHYLLVGWGTPLILITIWAALLAKYKSDDEHCWLPTVNTLSIFNVLIYSIYVALGVNLMIVIAVVWVLVSKLSKLPAVEAQQIKKSVKAICVLLPLLGSHYILTGIAEHVSVHTKEVFRTLRTFLQAFQGVLVATFYCFMNSDVLALLRQRMNAAQESRSIQRYLSASIHSKSGTSIPALSPPSYNEININRLTKTSVTSKGSVDEHVVGINHDRKLESSV